MKYLTIIVAFLAFLYAIATGFFDKSMYMKSPTLASGLTRINKISVFKITQEWLENEFRIKEKYITKAIIESISNYAGNCPCPYNKKSNGHTCGGTSAYSISGGYEVICYPVDVVCSLENK